jgi:hypothetical protein
METPKLLINSLISNNSLEDLKSELYKSGILCKDYDDNNLLLVYHKYNTPIKNDLAKECRSLIINKLTKKIISYSCETPSFNVDPLLNLYYFEQSKNDNGYNYIITECYDGTVLSVFFHENKWFVSTRRCLDSKDSIINDVSHYKLFEDIILSDKYNDLSDFYNELDKDKSYYFVLIHHLNKNVIDYSYIFSNNYKKLCLVSVRDSNLNEINLYEKSFNFNNNIFITELLTTIKNDLILYNHLPTKEGIIFKIWNNSTWKYNLIKYQYKNYEFHNAIGSKTHNMYKGLIYLYQKDELLKYIKYNPIFNSIESYNTLEVINSTFKVLTSEILQLFKLVCKNLSINKLLPSEYKNVIYILRITHSIENRLTIGYIYKYLKYLPFNVLLNLLATRHRLFTTSDSSETNLVLCDEFKYISYYCSNKELELCNLLIKKIS